MSRARNFLLFGVSSLLAAIAACGRPAPPAHPAGEPSAGAPTGASAEAGDDDDVPVRLEDLPAPVKGTVDVQSKGATVHGLSKSNEDGRLTYELELVLADGHRKDLDISPEGAVLEVEEEVAISAVPVAARQAIQTNAGTREILKIEAVSKGDGTLRGYEVGLRDGSKHSELSVAPDGKLLPADEDD